MRLLATRLRRLEQKLPARWQDVDFDIEKALDFRIAGVMRCIVQARTMLILDELANRKECPPHVQVECHARIRAIIPAFLFEHLQNQDDSRRQACRGELEAAQALVCKYAASVPAGSANQRGPTSRG